MGEITGLISTLDVKRPEELGEPVKEPIKPDAVWFWRGDNPFIGHGRLLFRGPASSVHGNAPAPAFH